VVDLMKNGEIGMLVNTVSGPDPRRDEVLIRTEAIARGIPVISTIAGAQAAADGTASLLRSAIGVRPLQTYGSAAAAGPSEGD
jgi:carbamoyl-phosphate synthase large subunit